MKNLIDNDINLDFKVRNFLYLEAEYMDDGLLEKWLEMVDESIRYIVPLRLTRLREDGRGFDEHMSMQDDDYVALKMRVKRLTFKTAWSENPPTRIRHHLSNIRVVNVADDTDDSKGVKIEVKSNILLYRSRGESPKNDLLSAERRDVLRLEAGQLKLLRREVLLDQTTLATHNLAMFF